MATPPPSVSPSTRTTLSSVRLRWAAHERRATARNTVRKASMLAGHFSVDYRFDVRFGTEDSGAAMFK